MDNIQAVKESTRDISNITRIKNRFGNRLKVFTGVDTLGLESILMGADGWVAGFGLCLSCRKLWPYITWPKLEKLRKPLPFTDGFCLYWNWTSTPNWSKI